MLPFNRVADVCLWLPDALKLLKQGLANAVRRSLVQTRGDLVQNRPGQQALSIFAARRAGNHRDGADQLARDRNRQGALQDAPSRFLDRQQVQRRRPDRRWRVSGFRRWRRLYFIVVAALAPARSRGFIGCAVGRQQGDGTAVVI